MNEKEKNKLGEILWTIATELRGSMNVDDFRDYMFSFLFLRYLSENYERAACKELGSDYPTVADDDERTPLAIWYAQNSEEDIRKFEDQMRRKVHYVIKPAFLWNAIAELARTHDNELHKTLEEAFKYIENESFSTAFDGLFSEINLNSEKLGKNYTARNEKLCYIITKIAEGIVGLSSGSDELGDAYEYLIEQFAARGSVKISGEFYTPQSVATILSRIVSLDSQDPSKGKKERLNAVFDFACGSGSLLLNIRTQMGKHGIGKIYGQEKNITTYNLARMNMLLHGVMDTEFEIYHGDSLTNDWEILKEERPTWEIQGEASPTWEIQGEGGNQTKNKILQFDAVVANPPFSLRWYHSDELAKDFRFKNYGLAPKSAADFAFLLHGFHFLKKEGTMAIILPHGVLFRGGVEARIREKLLRDGNIDTIIGLPPNLFFSTGIPVCILVLKKCKKSDDVLFINASSEENFRKDKRQNHLDDEHIDKIVKTYQYRKEEERYSRKVSMEEIEKNDYNLNITRYVSIAKPEPIVDLDEVHRELKEIENDIKKYTSEHNTYLRELGISELG